MKNVTIVGAGWAGLSAAVAATKNGCQVTLLEASQTAGGRARDLSQTYADRPLDNGQHVLIGAYVQTLKLMQTVGLEPADLLARMPLDLRLHDAQGNQSQGIRLPDLPSPFNLLVGMASAKGWSLRDKASLFIAACKWQFAHFSCDPTWTVTELCKRSNLTPKVIQQLIDPLCLSALNTPLEEASASVFLRVLHDALMGNEGNGCSSDLLVPLVSIGELFPHACLQWLAKQGADIQMGQRITADLLHDLVLQKANQKNHAIVLACPSWEAARLSEQIAPEWSKQAAALTNTAIATVYLASKAPNFTGLPKPLMALQSDAQNPAQFVFDRGALTQQPRLLAAVISVCSTTLERDQVSALVKQQLTQQLGLEQLEVIQTVIEKRAAFACRPNIKRPDALLVDGLWACGDYIAGPYPSTLEGAVRSGQNVIAHLEQLRHS